MTACKVKGCTLDFKAHGRRYDHLRETIGPRAADDFALQHDFEEDEDPCGVRFSATEDGPLTTCTLPYGHGRRHETHTMRGG